MLELDCINDMFKDIAVQKNKLLFFIWVFDELKKEKNLDPAEQVDYLAFLYKKSFEVRDGLKAPADRELYEKFDDDFFVFLQQKNLVGTPATNGQIALHFMGGLDGVVLLNGVEQEKIMELFARQDKQEKSIFEGKDGFERRILLEELVPENRMKFLWAHPQVLMPLDGGDIAEIVQDFSSEQLNRFFSHTEEGQPALWDRFNVSVRQDILRFTTCANGVKWKGPKGKEGNSGGHGRV